MRDYGKNLVQPDVATTSARSLFIDDLRLVEYYALLEYPREGVRLPYPAEGDDLASQFVGGKILQPFPASANRQFIQ